jgi:hypothetical protein
VFIGFDDASEYASEALLMRRDVARLARVRVVADHLVAIFEESTPGRALS